MRTNPIARRAGRGALALLAALAIPIAAAGQAAASVQAARATSTASSTAENVGKLAVSGGTLPAAKVGQPYSYRFRVLTGGSALWTPIGGLPLGLSLDSQTGVLSGVPREAGGVQVLVSATRGGAHLQIGTGNAFLPVADSPSGAANIWETGSRARLARAASALTPRTSATGSVTIPAATVASSLYQAMYFQAVNNPNAPSHDLSKVLLADVAAQVYATDPGASPSAVEGGLAALQAAFNSATNPLAPPSAGAGLNSFGPNLVPQLTGALGIMQSFGGSSGAGVDGPAVQAVASSIYGSYLNTSIVATSSGGTPLTGITQGYAGFNDRSLYDVGDMTASGFHALVSGPAISQAVTCGQASAACASVEDSLLTPVVDTGLGSTASVPVNDTPAQLQTSDSTLSAMLSSSGLNLTLNTDGSLTLPAGGYDTMLAQVGNLNLTLTQSDAVDIKSLIASAGDPANPGDISGVSAQDLTNQLPGFNVSLTSSLFTAGVAKAANPKDAGSDTIAGFSADQIAQGATSILKALGDNNSKQMQVLSGVITGALDIFTGNYAGAVMSLLSMFLGGGPSEAYQLAQQTDQMIQTVYANLSQDLSEIQGSIASLASSLNSVYVAMENGFTTLQTSLNGLAAAIAKLGQLQYQMDLTDGDVVAFEKDAVQTDIAKTINGCLDLQARNLAPLDFPGYTACETNLMTDATSDAGANAELFQTSAPPAPGTDLSPDGTVAAALAQHGMDPDQELYYLMSILNHWYGIGTDPATLGTTPLVNPAVWSEIALAYRELLDQYPQYSAGTNPDLASVEAPGVQVAQLVSALQADNSANGWWNPALADLEQNYQNALGQYASDINSWQAGFPQTNNNQPTVGFGTPDGGSWRGYNAFNGPEQTTPAGDDPAQHISSLVACGYTTTLALPSASEWEGAANLPSSWILLNDLVGYSNSALKPTTTPLCYNFSSTKPVLHCTVVKNTPVCYWAATMSGSLVVQFEGTDGSLHNVETITTPVQSGECSSQSCFTPATYFDNLISANGSLAGLLDHSGGTTATANTSVLDSEGAQILAAEQDQVYNWDIDGLTNAKAVGYTQLTNDGQDLTGAFELLQLGAQTLTPSASLGNQAVSDYLYGQDQLATTAASPNGPLPVLKALATGSTTTTVNGQTIPWSSGWANTWDSAEYAGASEVFQILNGNLASESQATSASPASHGAQPGRAIPNKGGPPSQPGDLATADAPALTYSVLDQLSTGQSLDTDSVTVASPGAQASFTGHAVNLQVAATSSAGAAITGWSATGLPPGLSVNASSGVISGTPTATGTYSATVTATDTIGSSEHNSGQATFGWTVTAPPPDQVTVAAVSNQAGVVGKAVTLQLSAKSADGNAITAWSAAGLPPGLSVNASSGVISGTPATAGTATVTVTAQDSAGTTGQATFTWKVVPACGKQLIGNGGFESGLAPWQSTAGVRIASAKATPAYAGKYLARLGGRTAPRTDTLSQTVTIQASCANATLAFYQRIITNDPSTKAYDTIQVQVLNSAGKVVKILATYSNKNAAASYARHTFSLKAYIGQKVTIRFASSETLKGHATSFLIDNVALGVG